MWTFSLVITINKAILVNTNMFTIQHSGTISNRVAPEQGTTAFCSLIDAMFYKATGTYIGDHLHQAPL